MLEKRPMSESASIDRQDSLRDLLCDPDSGAPLTWAADRVHVHGRTVAPVVAGIPRFVDDGAQASFGLQWNRFARVQLDSVNGTRQSRDRLFDQSGLRPEDFADRTVLEVGCGAGRFTEILLSLGARLVSIDYSSAVDANAANHRGAFERGDVVLAQGDVFRLPVRDASFDIVLCYGVLQHTGQPTRALEALWQKVAPGGRLLVDRYGVSVRNVMPFKYLLRPLTKRLPAERLLRACDAYVRAVHPVQRLAFGALQGAGARRVLRLAANRLTLNSVFPINLEVRGELSTDLAIEWSVLDTFDMLAPRYDWPCTFAQWQREVDTLDGEVERCAPCGQGSAATVRKRR